MLSLAVAFDSMVSGWAIANNVRLINIITEAILLIMSLIGVMIDTELREL